MAQDRHRIAVTTGEPAGIGPDIVLAMARQNPGCELVAIGDPLLLEQRAALLGLDVKLVETHHEVPVGTPEPGTLKIWPVALHAPCTPGMLEPHNAAYVLEILEIAARGCLDGTFSAMVTAPVQKSVINDAGIRFSGHTEFLAELTDTPQVVMMLVAGRLCVALATTHIPLAAVPAAISATLLESTLEILDRDLRLKFGIDTPRLAVLGLNPHAGESGHLGREEIEIISPVIERMKRSGLHLTGPLPADTAFNPEVLDAHDAVLAMYHDQGLPVLKYAGFGEAVNVTLGLPILRTSVDHGTALALAGTGMAASGSLAAAVAMAVRMARRQLR